MIDEIRWPVIGSTAAIRGGMAASLPAIEEDAAETLAAATGYTNHSGNWTA